MIHEIEELFDNTFKNCSPQSNDSVICFDDGKILLHIDDNGTINYPTVREIDSDFTYLFSVGSVNYFLSHSEPFGDYEYYNYTILRTAVPCEKAFAGVTAFQLNNWYNDNVFCGKCGKRLVQDNVQRALVCECGNIVYPKISPAVIVAITNGDKICLTKYNRPDAHWALVAGFNEIGETIEQTVHREVMEETGLKVKNLKYYKSQPWGFTSTLLFGFFCELDGDESIKLDNDELKAGRWFTREEILFDDDGLSLTREMIHVLKNNSLKI